MVEHTVKSFENEISQLRGLIAEMGGLAEVAIRDAIDALVQQTGMPRAELLGQLSEQLPQLVDQLTPDGRLPTPQETSRW